MVKLENRWLSFNYKIVILHNFCCMQMFKNKILLDISSYLEKEPDNGFDASVADWAE